MADRLIRPGDEGVTVTASALRTLLSSGAPSATTAVQRTSSRTNTFPFRSRIFPRAAGTLSTFALLRKDVS